MPVRPTPSPGQPSRPGDPVTPRRRAAWLRLPPALRRELNPLPGSLQRRRCLLAVVLALVALIARPLPPFLWLPGWCVGALLLWALAELLLWLWRPHRWR